MTVTTNDALLAFAFAMGQRTPSPDELCAGDIDDNGIIDTSDALCIFNMALGRSCSFTSARDDLAALTAAGENPALSAGSLTGAPGEILCLEIWLSPVPAGLNHLQFDVLFDETHLRYEPGAYEAGAVTEDWPIVGDSLLAPGRIRFGALSPFDSGPARSAGIVVSLQFEVVGPNSDGGHTSALRLQELKGGICGWSVNSGEFILRGR